jgi:hypothetical protein
MNTGMTFSERTLVVASDLESVRSSVLHGGYHAHVEGADNFFKPLAVHLNWEQKSETALEGSLSYWRSKNLCIFRFLVRLAPVAHGTQVTISTAHGPWSEILMVVTWIVGFCCCLVGAIIPFLQTKLYSRLLQQIADHVADGIAKQHGPAAA